MCLQGELARRSPQDGDGMIISLAQRLLVGSNVLTFPGLRYATPCKLVLFVLKRNQLARRSVAEPGLHFLQAGLAAPAPRGPESIVALI